MKDQDVRDLAAANAHESTRQAVNLWKPDNSDKGDGLTPLGRMADAMNGQPRAASYAPAETGRRAASYAPGRREYADVQVACPVRKDDGTICGQNRFRCEHFEPATGHKDPTGDAGLVPDHAARDRRELVKLLRAEARILRQKEDLLARWQAPAPATAADRAALERENLAPEPGCDSCARVEQAKGVPFWSPIKVKRKRVNEDGAMGESEEIALCRWCDDQYRASGVMPTVKQVERYRDTGKRGAA